MAPESTTKATAGDEDGVGSAQDAEPLSVGVLEEELIAGCSDPDVLAVADAVGDAVGDAVKDAVPLGVPLGVPLAEGDAARLPVSVLELDAAVAVTVADAVSVIVRELEAVGVNVPVCVDDAESVGDGLPEFVADHELVALGVDRGVTAPVPETEDVALAGAPGLIVCVTVGNAVTDGDVDAVCVGVKEGLCVGDGVPELDAVVLGVMVLLGVIESEGVPVFVPVRLPDDVCDGVE